MKENFSKKQTYFEFIKYILPSIISMIFLSFYTTIDGFFVSRFVNSDALASINIVLPLTCVVFGIAVMLATGSGALVGIKLGEKDKDGANKLFTFITLVLLVISIVFTLIGLIFLKPLLVFLGTTESIMPYASVYGFITVLMNLPMVFKVFFEYYARVDGNPTISLIMSSVGLILNIILDYLFIVIFKIGILGAALGTFFSITISAIIGLLYFLSKSSNLKFSKPKLYFKDLWNSCYNGSSEMFTEFSTGITTFLFNLSILHYYGENGVAAMSIITYMYYFFIAIYFGITVGISPVISYNYGAKNKEKIKESLDHSFVSIGISSLLIFVISMFFGKYIISFFTSDIAVYGIATSGIKLFSFGFLMIGLNVFMSGYFTSIGNGQVSAIISISRSLVFVTLAILILPRFIDVNGIWLAIPVAELLTVFLSITFYLKSNLEIEDNDNLLEHNPNI